MAEKNRRERLRPSRRSQVLQNYRLVWVDAGIDESNGDCQHILVQLRNVVNGIKIFQDSDTCVDFLQNVVDEKVFVIASSLLGKDLIPRIHSMSQVDTIYIFCDDEARHKAWSEQWSKIKGVYTRIERICEALRQSSRQCNQDCTPMSFVARATNDSTPNLNELEPSFMYTQLFKNALLGMEHERQALDDFVKYCREGGGAVHGGLAVIDEFQHEYSPDKAIWWYTRECFIYQMLNRALRLLQADIIVEMGFFVHDLHQQIEELHREQVSRYAEKRLTLYRGQGLSTADFQKLKSTEGALLSFNSFVSTSKNQAYAKFVAESSLHAPDKVGILFVMTIDPTVNSTPFADIGHCSYFAEEEAEVLFSMHSVFRIDRVIALDDHDRLWEVQLTLTADDDPQLRRLTAKMNEELQHSMGWERIGRLLISVGEVAKAEELYMRLLTQAWNESDAGSYHHYLGYVKDAQGDYTKALAYYEKALNFICQQTLPDKRPILANSLRDIGSVYRRMGEHQKALSYFEKALDMQQRALPASHPDSATSLRCIGMVYANMGDYLKALLYCEKCHDMEQKILSANHPSLAISFGNMGRVYNNMGEYSKALSYSETCLDMMQKTLPADHPHLASYLSNIGAVYDHIGDYSKAVSSLEASLHIFQKSLPPMHRYTAAAHNKLGVVFMNMKEHEKALSCHQKALHIREQACPANRLDLAQSYNNMGELYRSMGDNSKALSLYERALEIRDKTLQENHPDLATTLHNIGEVYCTEEKHSIALPYLKRGLKIRQHSLPLAHRDIKTSVKWIEIATKNTSNML